jgi:hypothetical protein
MSYQKRKRVELTLQKKFEIIHLINSGVAQKKISEDYQIGTSTVSDIVKNRQSILCKLTSADVNPKCVIVKFHLKMLIELF